MKCPRCGAEMMIDEHRKYALNMCYECGYMDGRELGELVKKPSNYEKAKLMKEAELAAFLASGLGLSEKAVLAWLEKDSE